MRAFRFLHLAILSVLVGCPAFVFAQDDKPQDNNRNRKSPSPSQSRKRPNLRTRPDLTRTSAKPSKQDQKHEQKESHDQMRPEGREHPEQQAKNGRPAGKSGHIPDDKFRAHFGRSHRFTARTVIVQGQPQFQYGGYSFQLVDAWPEGWAYTDECYIDYIDGEYFLFDLVHPGIQVAVFVVL
jgi:hypothetical protein